MNEDLLTPSDSDEPVKPDLRILDVNLNGVVYSMVLCIQQN